MRRSGETTAPPISAPASVPEVTRSDWVTLRRLFPYLWAYKWRVMAALAFMIGAKMANVSVPLLLKELIDTVNPKGGIDANALLVVPAALLLAYGALRLSTTLFAELRELIFAKATEGASRTISLQVFRHLHALRWHHWRWSKWSIAILRLLATLQNLHNRTYLLCIKSGIRKF